MKTYLDLLEKILNKGVYKEDRTNTGVLSLFGHQLKFDLSQGFPMVTTKKLHWESIVYELLWFLKGSTNTKYLNQKKVRIWNHWADENGDLGPIYGKQWRDWKGVDQIQNAIDLIKNNPDSRRIIVSAWNPLVLPDPQLSFEENIKNDKAALPPCHTLFQFYVCNGYLSCQLYQRSADAFLGLPFNIASYSLLTIMIAQVTNLKPGEFIHSIGDLHLYKNHIEQVNIQLNRKPKKLPTVVLNPMINNIFDFEFKDITLVGYYPHPTIKASVAI